jgi:hypothetical protein
MEEPFGKRSLKWNGLITNSREPGQILIAMQKRGWSEMISHSAPAFFYFLKSF